MEKKQFQAFIDMLQQSPFRHAHLKIDDFEVEIDGDMAQEGKLSDGYVLTSPMIGIFHANQPAVAVGDEVVTGNVLGQIESMKLYNDLVTESAGQIARVFVKDGQTVEYGQKLYEITVNGELD